MKLKAKSFYFEKSKFDIFQPPTLTSTAAIYMAHCPVCKRWHQLYKADSGAWVFNCTDAPDSKPTIKAEGKSLKGLIKSLDCWQMPIIRIMHKIGFVTDKDEPHQLITDYAVIRQGFPVQYMVTPRWIKAPNGELQPRFAACYHRINGDDSFRKILLGVYEMPQAAINECLLDYSTNGLALWQVKRKLRITTKG